MEPRHPIRVAAQRSGIAPDTLRAWERRHEVVQPGRSGTARRLYSDADIERLRLLRTLVDAGHGIGRIASLPEAELRSLLESDDAGPVETDARTSGASDSAPHPALGRAMDAMGALDATGLRRVLNRAAIELGPERFCERVLDPFCRAIGERWASGEVSVAHEHLASVAVRNALGGMLDVLLEDVDGPVALATTPAGERHELGAMMAAAAAAGSGWRVHYLGPDLPAADIAEAARHLGADVVLVSIVAEHGRDVEQELRAMREALGEPVTILAGGAGAAHLTGTLRAARIRLLPDLASLRRTLADLAPRPAMA